MTQQKFYVGDSIGYKSTLASGSTYIYFAGAAKLDAAWEVSLAISPLASGDGGCVFVSKFIVRPGETIRLAKGLQMYVDKEQNPQKSKTIPCSELRVAMAEQDCLTVDIYE